jgi:two-component system CheB/CheR fusion protein
MRVLPNRVVYVIPPNGFVGIKRKVLHPSEPKARRGVCLSIDFLFRSLSEDQGDHVISIVLSGIGTSGILGLHAAKGAGRLTLTQDGVTADYEGMLHSAIANGAVDFVLPAERTPELLLKLIQHSYATRTVLIAPGRN